MPNWMRYLVHLFIIITFCMLSGCVSLRLPADAKQTHFKVISSTLRQQHLSVLQQWQISGAFSIQQGKEVNVANYWWVQSGQLYYRIRIASTLNLYDVKLVGQPHRVTLWRSAKKPVIASSAERLLHAQMGWSLPVANLYYWIRGIAAPGLHHSQYDHYGHLQHLQQQGWNIIYQRYSTIGNVDLPRIMTLQYGHLKLKIVIKKWSMAK